MSAGVLANVFGPDGLIIIAVVVIVLLFGGSKLPELARGLGSASHEFKKGIAEGEESSKAAEAAKTAESAKDSEAPKDSSDS
ncbi:MAG: twin-arginine translocase TatA/TatE family subunit [Acidimicrobiales bacterium]